MRQILFLHGGDSFLSYDEYMSALCARQPDYERLKYHPRWREWIAVQLPEIHVLTPTMPNSDNAQYKEWQIYFEKLIPFLEDDFIIVGHSLGAMFLAKYLHSHTLPRKARKIILIAGRHGRNNEPGCGNFEFASAAGLERSANEVHLFHSEDDPIVPYKDVLKFHQDIPGSMVHSFKNRGHFIDSTFPEMLELLKQK